MDNVIRRPLHESQRAESRSNITKNMEIKLRFEQREGVLMMGSKRCPCYEQNLQRLCAHHFSHEDNPGDYQSGRNPQGDVGSV